MVLGGLYHKLLAAGAVALFVANWLCRPLWRGQGHETGDQRAPEQQALLESDPTGDSKEQKSLEAEQPASASYQAPEPERSDSAVAAEDVVLESSKQPSKPGVGSASSAGVKSAPAAAAGDSPGPSTSALVAGGTPAEPVNEDYLRSLLDQEFGPPKFAVRKEDKPEPAAAAAAEPKAPKAAAAAPAAKAASAAPQAATPAAPAAAAPAASAAPAPPAAPAAPAAAAAPADADAAAGAGTPGTSGTPADAQPQADLMSVEELLDQQFGPPKFAVPKPASPGHAPSRAAAAAATGAAAAAGAAAAGAGPANSGGGAAAAAPAAAVGAHHPHPHPMPDAEAAAALVAAAARSAGGGGAAAAAAPTAASASNAGAGSGAGSGAAAVGSKRPHEAVEAAAEAGAGAEEEEAEEEASSGGLLTLTFTISGGPVAGKVCVADDPAMEYKVGRTPECHPFQLLDAEVSGRHASLRWDGAARAWKLHDTGSLNGTKVNGAVISRDYKVPGDEVALADGDELEFGSVTRGRVRLTPSRPGGGGGGGGGGGVGGAGGRQGAQPAKRRHSEDAATGFPPGAGALTLSDLAAAAAAAAAGAHGAHASAASASAAGTLALGGSLAGGGLAGALPAPVALVEVPELGARLCVHNKLGVDHKRLGQGCEDVPAWELPFAPYPAAGLLCVFDGHHGSKAAHQAKEHVPAVLRHKLLLRDGRTPPPLAPPPPQQQPRRPDEEEEEELDEGYNDEDDEEAEEGEGFGEENGQKQTQKQQATSGRKGGKATQQAASKAKAQDAAAAVAAAPVRVEAEAALPAGLVPPPPAGPPLPPLLAGREAASQKALLRDAFLTCDRYMSMEEGCTATVVLLEALGGGAAAGAAAAGAGAAAAGGAGAGGAGVPGAGGWSLQSANVGDSSAVLINFTRGTHAKLSEDHRIASSVSERQRLAAAGHTVRTRLYGLNISRMLGDRFLKEEDLGFLAEPHVSSLAQVGPGEAAVLIVASDGLWDVLPEAHAARLLLQEAAKPAPHPASAPTTSAATPHPPAPPPPAGALSCQAVADLLLAQALVLRSKDDVTIAVLELGPHLLRERQG